MDELNLLSFFGEDHALLACAVRLARFIKPRELLPSILNATSGNAFYAGILTGHFETQH